jgi:protein-S-isoprenylcysteine O-methyltransferase Ste14
MDRPPRIVPPVYFIAAIIVMILLHRFLPIVHWLHAPWRYVGAIPLLAGVLLGAPSAAQFIKRGTQLRPAPGSSALVTSGAFRFTRNPMYVGMVLLVLGIAILLGSLSPLIVPVLLAVILQTQFIVHEEKWMEQRFGAEYREYKNRVHRWV